MRGLKLHAPKPLYEGMLPASAESLDVLSTESPAGSADRGATMLSLQPEFLKPEFSELDSLRKTLV